MLILIYLLFWGSVIGGGFYLVLRYVRAIEQRPPRVQDDLDIGKRVRLLEETIERQAVEIQQLTENQSFLESLLKSRPSLPPGEPSGN